MGIEKQTSKNGNSVSGFLQLFDWNAKSRKKLFSSKSDLPEKSKQKKKFHANFPTTHLQMPDDYEIIAGSSMKSDHSRASSATDDDFYRTRSPSVIARLMGLDSMPHEPYTTPFFDSQSLPASLNSENLDHHQDPQIMHSTTLQDSKYQNRRPIGKFRTEILLPKSAKSVPITHEKNLSPIKGSNLMIPPKDAAHIIEPNRKRGLNVQKQSRTLEGSRRPAGESNAVKILKGQSMSKSWNGSVDASPARNFRDSEKNKGKSISLALQAKANVQKREGLNKQEVSEIITNQKFTARSEVEKSGLKKPLKSSNVLRQNNQKQNCKVDRGKSPLKSNLSGDSSSSRKKKDCDKLVIKDDKKKVSSCSSDRVARKKQPIGGNYISGQDRTAQNVQKGKNGKDIRSSSAMHAQSSWNQDSEKIGANVISFTFTSPMTRCSAGSTDSLSTILEQKLNELTHKVKVSQLKSRTVLRDHKGFLIGQNFQVSMEEICMHERNTTEDRKLFERLPSPVSVLEHSSFTESCYSSDTADSNRYSTNTSDLSDSASSTSPVTVARKRESTLSTLPYHGMPRNWQLSYVKEMLCNIEEMFTDYASGETCEIIEPCLFDQLESRKLYFTNGCGRIPRINQLLLFDCVSECLEMRCKSWIKCLLVVKRKEKLAEDVYKEISDWSSMGDFMVDGLVDYDMSSGYGKWVDYEIEAFELGIKIESHIFYALVDEVVGDMLLNL